MPFCHKKKFCGPAREKTVAKSDGGGGLSIANEFVITESFCHTAKRPFPGHIPACSAMMLSMTAPCRSLSLPKDSHALAGSAAAPARVREDKTTSSARSRLDLHGAAQMLSSSGPSALPSQSFFLWESSVALQRNRLYTFVEWYLPPFTILWGCRGLEWPVALQGILQTLQSCSWELTSPAGPRVAVQGHKDPLQLVAISPFLLLVQLSEPTITLDKWGLVFEIITSVSWHFQDILGIP